MAGGLGTSELFGGTYARGGVAAAVSDTAWVQALLDVEAALGGPALSASSVDIASLGRLGGEHASVVVVLAQSFAETHRGATSQDILDTAMMLVAQRAFTVLVEDVQGALGAAAALASRYRDTPVLGLTLMQPALPTTFGLRAAGWMTGITMAATSLSEIVLPVQMGGAVGTRSADVGARVAGELGLADPGLAWHTNRVPVAQLACALGVLCGSLAKVARDVTLCPWLSEGVPGRGGSSAIPGKHNPVAAVSVLACSRRAPGLVATMLGCMEQEFERAAGAWQSEWGTLTDLLRLTGSAAAWGRDMLSNLEVDEAAMSAGVDLEAADVGSASTAGSVDVGAAGELVDRALERCGFGEWVGGER